MIQSDFTINGITCNNCVKTLTELFVDQNGVSDVLIDKQSGKLSLIAPKAIDPKTVVQSLAPLPKYQLVEDISSEQNEHSFKPLILVIAFILLSVLLAQINQGEFDMMQSMRLFMGGFFIVFSFFKFLNLNGFANAYLSYDIIASQWKTWGYVYPFIELGLGVMYILNAFPLATNLTAIVVMGLSSVGVVKAIRSESKIKCACLGTGFNLPMTTVTLIEDLGMVVMAAIMLYLLY